MISNASSHRLWKTNNVLSWIARFWPLGLPLLLFLPGITGFPYPGLEAKFSDISIAHYPYALYLRQSIMEGRLPIWSPLFFSGMPFAANPLSGMWYPPGWLALLLPIPLGFNLLVMAHSLFGGIGLYRLLRGEGLGHAPALLGGLALMAMPKIFAHFGAGHLTLLYALPWTPWLLLASRSTPTGATSIPERSSRGWRHLFHAWIFPAEAAILALIFLADPRWSVFAGLIWWGYRLFGSVDSGQPALLSRLGGLVVQTGWAALLAAPLVIPLFELTRLSTRSQMQSGDVLAFSLPWPRMLGMVIPDTGGFHEYMLYVGQALIGLCFFVLLWRVPRKKSRFWLLLAGLALLFSLGENFAPVRWLAGLPLVGLLRVPARALFVFGLAVASVGAFGLQGLIDGLTSAEKRRASLFLTGYAGFLTLLAAGVWAVSGTPAFNFTWAAILGIISAVWLGWGLRVYRPDHARSDPPKRDGRRYWLAGLFLLCLLDWGMIDRSLFSIRPPEQVLAEGSALAQRLIELGKDADNTEAGLFRVYSPSYSIPQQTSAFYGLQLADGVDPLQLASYVEFMEQATGTPIDGYSVTFPPFSSGDPVSDNAGFRPDPARLRVLNVHYVTAEFDLAVDGLDLIDQIGGARLYLVRDGLPRAWIQPEGAPIGAQARPVEQLDWRPERIMIQAAGPGLLVLSEIAYPGWRVSVDGKPVQMKQADGESSGEAALSSSSVQAPLRTVLLEPGLHQVIFAFRPVSVYLGIGLGGLGWFLSACLLVNRLKRGGGRKSRAVGASGDER